MVPLLSENQPSPLSKVRESHVPSDDVSNGTGNTQKTAGTEIEGIVKAATSKNPRSES